MLKRYQTLEKMLSENHFDVFNCNIIDSHIIGQNTKNKKTYICHFEIKDEMYCLGKCKMHDEKEAILIAIKLLTNVI